MANQSAKLIECPRDAWQGLPRQIPTEMKVQYLGALIGAGFKNIDAVSFVSPKAVPQMADSEQVLKQLDPPDNVEIIGIVVNEKGAERAISTKHVTTLGYPCSISPTFLRRNQNQSPEENFETLITIKRRADKADVDLVAVSHRAHDGRVPSLFADAADRPRLISTLGDRQSGSDRWAFGVCRCAPVYRLADDPFRVGGVPRPHHPNNGRSFWYRPVL